MKRIVSSSAGKQCNSNCNQPFFTGFVSCGWVVGCEAICKIEFVWSEVLGMLCFRYEGVFVSCYKAHHNADNIGTSHCSKTINSSCIFSWYCKLEIFTRVYLISLSLPLGSGMSTALLDKQGIQKQQPGCEAVCRAASVTESDLLRVRARQQGDTVTVSDQLCNEKIVCLCVCVYTHDLFDLLNTIFVFVPFYYYLSFYLIEWAT